MDDFDWIFELSRKGLRTFLVLVTLVAVVVAGSGLVFADHWALSALAFLPLVVLIVWAWLPILIEQSMFEWPEDDPFPWDDEGRF